MGLIRYANTDIYYEVHGQGAPLLYLHGWNGSMGGFKKNVLPGIGTGRQVILLDLPGCGRSGYADISFAAMADLIRDLLTGLGLRSASVAGFCLGGVFVLDFALRYPQMTDEVFLIETAIGFPVLLQPLLVPGLGRRLLHSGLHSRLGTWSAFAYLLRRGISYRKEFLAGFAANDTDISQRYLQLVRDYGRVDHLRRVREQLGSPLILVNGEKPPYYVRNSTRELLKASRSAQLFVLRGARHFVVEERPDLLAGVLEGKLPELQICPVSVARTTFLYRPRQRLQHRPTSELVRV